MKTVGNILRGLGYIWLGLVVIAMLIGYGMIWYQDGWSAVAEVASPWNPANLVVTLVALAPGIGLKIAGEKLRDRAMVDN